MGNIERQGTLCCHKVCPKKRILYLTTPNNELRERERERERERARAVNPKNCIHLFCAQARCEAWFHSSDVDNEKQTCKTKSFRITCLRGAVSNIIDNKVFN